MIKSLHISPRTRQLILETLAFLFIVLFTYGAVTKLLILEEFQVQLEQFPYVSGIAEELGYMIPTLQLLIAILFFFHRFRRLAFYASLGIMLLFSLYIVAVLNFADSIPCSCGGIIHSLSWTEHLVFNSVFIILAILAILLSGPQGKNSEIQAAPLKMGTRN